MYSVYQDIIHTLCTGEMFLRQVILFPVGYVPSLYRYVECEEWDSFISLHRIFRVLLGARYVTLLLTGPCQVDIADEFCSHQFLDYCLSSVRHFRTVRAPAPGRIMAPQVVQNCSMAPLPVYKSFNTSVCITIDLSQRLSTAQ